MAATFVAENGETTIKLEYTALTETVISVVGDAAHYLFDKGKGDHGTDESPIVWDDLTNQEKLDIVYDQIKQEIIDKANTYKSQLAQTTARETEAASKYEL